MKKSHYFILIYLVFLIILGVYIGSYWSPKNYGEKYKGLYLTLDYQISKIEDNINEIAIKDKNGSWSGLVKKDISDSKLLNTYDSIFNDIKTCYISIKKIDDQNVLFYKRRSKISIEKIKDIEKRDNCLSLFSKYYIKELSNNSKLSKKMNTQIKIITEYEVSDSGGNFENLLFYEADNVSKLASLSYWLKIEYLNSYNY